MQRWWLVVAGILGVALAVLLIPRPDTGGEVRERPIGEIDVEDPARRGDEGLVTVGTRPGGGMGEIGPDGQPIAGDPASGEIVRRDEPNPKAAALAARRDVPEVRYAGKALAPWTQVRRLLSMKSGENDDPELAALRDRADEMTRDLRLMLRDPSRVDWAGFEAAQAELAADIRASSHTDAEVEKMLTLVDERMVEYREDAADQ